MSEPIQIALAHLRRTGIAGGAIQSDWEANFMVQYTGATVSLTIKLPKETHDDHALAEARDMAHQILQRLADQTKAWAKP